MNFFYSILFQSPPPLQIFLLGWDEFPLLQGWERKRIWYSFTISKILWSFVRNCHFFTKCFSLPALWTFGSWTDENNLFISLWAYGNFSHWTRVGISLKKVVFICIFTSVLVNPVEVPALLLAVGCCIYKKSPPSILHDVVCLAGGLCERTGFHLQHPQKQHLPPIPSIACEPSLFLISAYKTLCQKDLYFLWFCLYVAFHNTIQSTETSVVWLVNVCLSHMYYTLSYKFD